MVAPAFPVVSLYAVPLALLFLVLSARVILARRRTGIAFGFRNDLDLERRIRVHANFVEYAPLGLLLLIVAEASGASGRWLHIDGGLLLFGRLAHALGVSLPQWDGFGRVTGMAGSQIAILISVGLILANHS